VLIVDDEPDVHLFIKAALEDEGYDFLDAADGEAGLALARSERPSLIILDVQMPKKGGFTVFGELREDEATRGTPVIMLTAVSARVGLAYSGEDMGAMYGSEPDAFIDKPVDPATLRDTARGLVQAGGA
jgi:two-component system alkaline phosphatase synthesis response regulator PhoP